MAAALIIAAAIGGVLPCDLQDYRANKSSLLAAQSRAAEQATKEYTLQYRASDYSLRRATCTVSRNKPIVGFQAGGQPTYLSSSPTGWRGVTAVSCAKQNYSQKGSLFSFRALTSVSRSTWLNLSACVESSGGIQFEVRVEIISRSLSCNSTLFT